MKKGSKQRNSINVYGLYDVLQAYVRTPEAENNVDLQRLRKGDLSDEKIKKILKNMPNYQRSKPYQDGILHVSKRVAEG